MGLSLAHGSFTASPWWWQMSSQRVRSRCALSWWF